MAAAYRLPPMAGPITTARWPTETPTAAEEGKPAFVEWLFSAQQWAIDVCVEARLELRAGGGAVFLGGDVASLRPYLPSGAYL